MDQPSSAITADPQAIVVPPKAPAKSSTTDWTPALILSAGILVVLAVFLGSFRPQNSDLWLTLGTGQLIASGEYQFGKDPFSWASDGAFWANPSWLSSLAAYEIYIHFGPAALIIAKSGLVVLLAWLLFAARRDGAPLLPSLELAALALLAASPRFYLQSTVISFVLLAALIYFLVRDFYLGGFGAENTTPQGPIWLVPLLFLAWSNLDGFFVVGLLALAVVSLGLAVFADTRPSAKRLGIILGLSIVASVLNPHLLANLTLPTDIAYIVRGVVPDAWTAAGRTAAALDNGDPGFYSMVSPFSSTAIAGGGFNNNIAGYAFYLLLLVNVVSFVACGFVPGTKGGGARGLLCLTFGILAAFQIRLIPFYAIVAGPISGLNFADYTRWARLRESLPSRGLAFASWTTLAALLGITLFAWPGWLHMGISQFRDDVMFQSSRRVEWDFQPDPSLQKTAESLKAAQERGEVHNVYNFTPDLAHYCAYFAPQVKCGVDQRLALFVEKARDYAAVRNDLWDQGTELAQPPDKQPQKTVEHVWPKIFADWKIDAVAVTNFNPQAAGKSAMPLAVRMMSQRPRTWKLSYADGRALVFDYSAANEFPEDALFLRWRREAFAPQPKSTWLPETHLVPPRELSWAHKYALGLGATPLESSTGLFEMESFLRYSQAWLNPYFQAHQMLHILPAAGHAGVVPGHILALGTIPLSQISDKIAATEPRWFHSVDFGPPALPILAERSFRQSLDKNPNLPGTYFRQAQNTQGILAEESWWNGHQLMTLRTQLRQLEHVAALRNALTLAPNTFEYQFAMNEFLKKQHYLDAALYHFQEAAKQIEVRPGLDAAQKHQIDELIRQQKLWEKELKRRMDDYELKAAGVSDMERARIAFARPYRFTDLKNNPQEDPQGRGLVLEALKVLGRINPATLNDLEKEERAYYLVRLNCFLGNITEAAEHFNKNKENLGQRSVECSLWVAAATGWYKELDDGLAILEANANPARQMPEVVRRIIPVIEKGCLLPQLPLAARIHAAVEGDKLTQLAQDIVLNSASQVNEMRTLRGIYALERGDIESARDHFDRALKDEVLFPDRPIAVRYRELIDAAANP